MFFLCFLAFLGFLKKRKHFWKVPSLKDNLVEHKHLSSSTTTEGSSASVLEHRRTRIERIGIDHTRSQARAQKRLSAKCLGLSVVLCSSAPIWDQVHSSAQMRQKTFSTLERVFSLLLGIRDQPTVILGFLRLIGSPNPINRPLYVEKKKDNLGEKNWRLEQEAFFSFFFPF